MTISSNSVDRLAGNINPDSPQVGVALLKKAQDQMKQEGDAMLKLIESAGAPNDGRRFDAQA